MAELGAELAVGVNAGQLPLLLPPGGATAAHAFLARLVRYDPRVAVRLQLDGARVALWAPPPTGVLVVIALPLAEPAHPHWGSGLTVSASRLLDAVDAGAVDGPEVDLEVREVALPEPVTGPGSLGHLPARSGWVSSFPLPGRAAAGAVDSLVTRVRGAGLSVMDPQALADELWDGDSFPGIPSRALHGLRLLGLLPGVNSPALPESLLVADNGPWRRVGWRAGSAVWRVDKGPTLLFG